MENNTFLILGGYGGAGFPIARLLLQETNVRLILAGRSREKAEKTALLFHDHLLAFALSWKQKEIRMASQDP